MTKLDKKPTFLENVEMMINDTIDRIKIDPNISKILKTCRSVIQLKFPVKTQIFQVGVGVWDTVKYVV